MGAATIQAADILATPEGVLGLWQAAMQAARDCTNGDPFNSYFGSQTEARLMWGLSQMGLEALDSKRGKPPRTRRTFPGDAPAVRAISVPRGKGNLFDRLRQLDLSEYAARYTELIPAGPGKWKGRCPLHEERTPSFNVTHNDARGWRWRCFGACATGGDIVDLARELKVRQKAVAHGAR